MKLRPSYDMSKFRLGTSGILNVIMGSGPRLASPNFILGGGLFSRGGGYSLNDDISSFFIIPQIVLALKGFLLRLYRRTFVFQDFPLPPTCIDLPRLA